MIFSPETIRYILDIQKNICLTPEEMARNLKVTFYPYNKGELSEEVLDFKNNLEKALIFYGVKIIPYKKSLIFTPLLFKIKKIKLHFFLYLKEPNIKNLKLLFIKLFNFKSIKKGIAIFVLGEIYKKKLPVDYTMSFKENPVINIIKRNIDVNYEDDFDKHTNYALNKFSWNIANLVISVNKQEWYLYSFNMSYPKYLIESFSKFKANILQSLIPKIYAPVIPPKFSDFIFLKDTFNSLDNFHLKYTKDLIDCGPFFKKSNLFPEQRSVESLKFRSNYYKWIGKIHLDKRSGMSYGFIARQLPTKLMKIKNIEDNLLEIEKFKEKGFRIENNKVILLIKMDNLLGEMELPDVWVLTSRSGSDKTNLDPISDIVKIGLKKGKMYLQKPRSLDLKDDYKPSFDSKIILSHAVANSIFASILKHFNPNSIFSEQLEYNGMALAHWHGYINPKFIPKGWFVYGYDMPPVSCSSPQAAIYAFMGKERVILECLKTESEFLGDIHIEPQHGINISYPSLFKLSYFILSNNNISKLGNEYLKYYSK